MRVHAAAPSQAAAVLQDLQAATAFPHSCDLEGASHVLQSLSPRSYAPETREAWRTYLQQVGAGDAVNRQFERLGSGAAVVVTGQQAGLLTGPLYTWLKAARAISVARELEARSGQPVVPVFWVAADDHDLGEINHTFVRDRESQVRRIRVDFSATRRAAGEMPVPDQAKNALSELQEFGSLDPEWLTRFDPQSGDTWSRWFSRCLLQVFGEEGLVPVEPALLGREAQPLFDEVLSDVTRYQLAFLAGSRRLQNAGLATPLDPNVVPVFWLSEDSRDRLTDRGDGSYGWRGGPLDSRELSRVGPSTPRVSADASLRPLIQDRVLPVAAFIAGPGELRYWAQLRELHAEYDISMPAVLARPEATLADAASLRTMRKIGIRTDQLWQEMAGPREEASHPSEGIGQDLRQQLDTFLQSLENEGGEVWAVSARKARQLSDTFDQLLERSTSARKQGQERARLHREGLGTLIRPREKPQERVLNGLPFLASLGPGLIRALLDLEAEPGHHWLLSPDGEW